MRPIFSVFFLIAFVSLSLGSENYHVFASGGLLHDFTYEVEGESVAPFGYPPGSRVAIIDAEPQIGDLVVFLCDRAECDGPYMKKLVKKKENCYWLEGRKDKWVGQDGKRKYSIDSRTTFGWLCGENISVVGIAQRA